MEALSATHCLDACAAIAYLRKEPGAEVLGSIIEDSSTWLVMHACNLTEVYYDFLRAGGEEAAQKAWQSILTLPLTLRRDMDDLFLQRVGEIKVEERVSFADSFALALSERLQIPVVTTDRHEFGPVEGKGLFRFVWLR